MLQTKWIVFVAAIWIALSMVLCVAEGAMMEDSDPTSPYYYENAETNQITLTEIQDLKIFKADDLVSLATAVFDTKLWNVALNMVTLNYPGIFYGDWGYARMAFLLPVTIGMIFTIVYSAIRMVRGGSGV